MKGILISTRSIRCLLLSTLLSICVSCSTNESKEPAEVEGKTEENVAEFTQAQYKTARIELGKIEKKQISGTISASGVIDVPPQQLISVSIPIGGFLKNTELLQGVRVRKGQIIATLESMDFVQMQQEYIEAKNQMNLARTDYERQQELARENINSTKTLQQSQANFATWQGKVKALLSKLKMVSADLASLEQGDITNTIKVFSPINGYVTEVNVNIGKFVNPSDVLFEIVNTEHLHAELTIFEKDIPKIKIGQKVRFTLANETTERTSTVYLIGRKISDDRTIRIHCHIDAEDADLLPGMYLKAQLETGGLKVDALPDEAVIDYQGDKYIFVTTEQANHKGDFHFKMLDVQTGSSEMGFTEVTVSENIEMEKFSVVTEGAYAILSKLKNAEEEE
ncbi:MAG: efflux RND transporter periplasmic adaptor subunit [Chryseolinea sp.]